MHRQLLSSPPFLRLAICTWVLVAVVSAQAQEALPKFNPPAGELTSEEGAWEYWRIDGSTVARRVLHLAPQPEPQPALSVQLIPDEFHLKDGNAAVFYLQAMGFLEQSAAQRAKGDFEQENQEAATASGKQTDQVPPHVWRSTRPEDLPVDQVREYLGYTSFQQRYLKESVQRRRCDFNRNIREVENPVMYLLPEIQSMRELARTQSLRFLLAMAEDRTDDGVAIMGQQLAMAPHLSQEPFLVSNLVGVACASIGLYDAFYLCEHESASNLYWAIAALPQPLSDMRPALAYEREFLFEQFKLLREVDETPRSNLYWKRFLERFSQSLEGLSTEANRLNQFGGSGMVLAVAAGVPGARRFLHEVEGLSIEELDELPNTQVFFLAVRRYHERTRDKTFKWAYLPHWEREASQFDQDSQDGTQEFGVMTVPSGLVLPAIQAAMSAQTRLQQLLAFFQTVESIRHHLATHNEQLPGSLSELILPAPADPATGRPFQYTLHDQGATLAGSRWPGFSYQFELRVR